MAEQRPGPSHRQRIACTRTAHRHMSHHTSKKGTQMSRLRSTPTPVGPRAGVSGPACSLAFQRTSESSRAPQITRAPLIIALASLCALCLAVFAPIPAQAAFTRPFRYGITGTSSESFYFNGHGPKVQRTDGLA